MHNPKSVEFHQCRAKRHLICFYHSINDNERNLYRYFIQMSYLYASDFPFKTFCKLAQNADKTRKNVWEKIIDA